MARVLEFDMWEPLTSEEFIDNPWEMIRRMERDISKLFNQLDLTGGGRFQAPKRLTQGREGEPTGAERWTPLMDVIEGPNERLIRIDLPGVKREDIKVQLQEGKLLITGEKTGEKLDNKYNYLRQERYQGSFRRRATVPEGVTEKDIKADFEHSVLTIHINLPQTFTSTPTSSETSTSRVSIS